MSQWNVIGLMQIHKVGPVCRFQADDLHHDRSDGGAGCVGSDLLPAGQIFTGR